MTSADSFPAWIHRLRACPKSGPDGECGQHSHVETSHIDVSTTRNVQETIIRWRMVGITDLGLGSVISPRIGVPYLYMSDPNLDMHLIKPTLCTAGHGRVSAPPLNDERRPSTVSLSRTRLRPGHTMPWDPKERSVGFFINRFIQVARTEGESEVLLVLPLCLRDDAIDWHSRLTPTVWTAMDMSLAEWERQLPKNFLPNQAEAAARAKQL